MQKLLDVKNLKTYFYTEQGTVRAVDGISFSLDKGTTLGVVGESGCGKSVTARSILRITGPRSKIVDGQMILYRDHEVVDLAQLDDRGPEIRDIRGQDIAMVFQEPMASLSPVHTIGDQIIEAISLHQDVDQDVARQMAIDILGHVGIPRPEQRVDEYPHQLSGGMRQRAMIAMALSCRPKLLIADEPTTALDVTIQAQILDLMRDLQAELGMSIMLITHDLGVVAELSDEVIVMYLGQIVEQAPVRDLFHNPLHPYTQALLRSVPKIEKQRTKEPLFSIKGVVPDPFTIPSGCRFHPRCQRFQPGLCDRVSPELEQITGNRSVSCLLVKKEESRHA